MPGETSSAPDAPIVWLSGVVQTFTSKVVMPTLWVAALVGLPLWVWATRGRISVRPDAQFIVWFALIATVPLAWFTWHLQLVGYRGRQLVVANFWREASIPFEDVKSVETVLWYRGRLVRIRFRRETPFGTMVYYMPKWGAWRAWFSNPEDELRAVLWEDLTRPD